MSDKKTIENLMDIMARLRNPENGCPWDLEQNFKSIAPHTIEEAYEVADAVERGDMEDLREELGDLLFQSVYHAQMAAEQNHFDLHDVIHDITIKMIRRHPHVFGDKVAKNASDVNKIWDNQKSQEKVKKTDQSALDDIPRALPALRRAQKIQKKATSAGFKWSNIQNVIDKLQEEISELKQAIANPEHPDHIEEELGDTLFMLAYIARHFEINAENAMNKANLKFTRRFKGMEADLDKMDKSFGNLTKDQMMQLWQDQKVKERNNANQV